MPPPHLAESVSSDGGVQFVCETIEEHTEQSDHTSKQHHTVHCRLRVIDDATTHTDSLETKNEPNSAQKEKKDKKTKKKYISGVI